MSEGIQNQKLSRVEYVRVADHIRMHRDRFDQDNLTHGEVAQECSKILGREISARQIRGVTNDLEISWGRSHHVPPSMAKFAQQLSLLEDRLDRLTRAYLALCYRLGERIPDDFPTVEPRSATGHLLHEPK